MRGGGRLWLLLKRQQVSFYRRCRRDWRPRLDSWTIVDETRGGDQGRGRRGLRVGLGFLSVCSVCLAAWLGLPAGYLGWLAVCLSGWLAGWLLVCPAGWLGIAAWGWKTAAAAQMVVYGRTDGRTHFYEGGRLSACRIGQCCCCHGLGAKIWSV